MAYNPPLSINGVPLRVEGEYMILERNNIEIEVNIPVLGVKKSKGKLLLTTARLVFVSKDYNQNSFKSFDFPLTLIRQEDFKQPIFGANYLCGKILPLYNLIPGVASFKLWFMQGGCSLFLKCFCMVLDQIRKNGNRGLDKGFVEQVRTGSLGNNQAFVDPNDPSIMFVTQPQDTYFNAMQNGTYIGTNYVTEPEKVNVPTHFVDFSQSQNKEPNKQQNKEVHQIQVSNNPQNQHYTYPQQQDVGIVSDSESQQKQDQQIGNQQQQPNIFQIPPQDQQVQQQQTNQQQQQQRPMNASFYFGIPLGPKLQNNQQ